ncbi:MAG: ATP-binding protein, partial [Planctomycetota bacterium]|nr:ATP-binding protein [Planctomycetota bacterium]
EGLEKRFTINGQIDLEEAGRGLTLLASGTKIFDDSGEDRGVVVVFDDATEQAKAQRVAAWREVARRIAHEIKNPITPIKLSAQRLLRRYKNKFTDEDQHVFESCIQTILAQVDSLRDMVNEFSKFARLPTIKAKPEDVNGLILDVANLYSLSYPKVQFDTTGLTVGIPQVLIDREQMNRVIMNVVSNAIGAFEDESAEPVVEFRSKVVENLNALRIEVSDNGKGIPAKIKDKVFEPYYSTKKDGTGLGLAIVNQIVSDHGGYIRLADREPTGTTVVIDLPLSQGSVQRA